MEFEVLQKHQENNYVDFYKEGLVIRELSKEGPAIATGDLDGDGKTDLCLTGASGQSTRIYLQKNETFKEMESEIFEKHAFFEDTEALLFDADQDGDLDLFLGSGGNKATSGSLELQDRLYLNDGNGQFSFATQAIPANGFNTSVAVAIDYDADGKQDLFVGSRSVSGDYGKIPPSFLYHNLGGGKFENLTKQVAPKLEKIGMVTDAVAVDTDGDGKNELVVVGEWMSPVVFELENAKFVQVSTGLENLKGWWNSVESADLNEDGKMDLVFGNRGENFYFSANAENPVKLWRSDFDKNGTTDKIMTRSIGGRDLTLHMKKELTNQIVSLKKQSLKHSEFAKKSIQQLFDEKTLSEAKVLEANHFKSGYALNQGDGKFSFTAFPYQTQLSSTRDILPTDLNGDGHQDLILVGNDYGFLPQYGRLDASRGEILLGDGKGNFKYLNNAESGFEVKGASREIKTFNLGEKIYYLVAVNGEKLKVFEKIERSSTQ